jgi:uncharacterized iron-regulated protein
VTGRCLAFLALLIAAGCAAPPPGTRIGTACVPVGSWVAPRDGAVIAEGPLFQDLARSGTVLLGESHTNAAHHRWQAETIERLYALEPHMAIGVEMLPRRAQPALDRWSAGTTGESEFLAESNWARNWGIDFALYRPVFAFARDKHLGMVALNVERTLVAKVARNGFAAIDVGEREGVGSPAAPSARYRAELTGVYEEHRRNADAAALEHFIEAQLLWDRAMAEALQSSRAPLVVALVGATHAAQFDGVPHQLAALGAPRARVLLPWDEGRPCSDLAPDLADAVFGLE